MQSHICHIPHLLMSLEMLDDSDSLLEYHVAQSTLVDVGVRPQVVVVLLFIFS